MKAWKRSPACMCASMRKPSITPRWRTRAAARFKAIEDGDKEALDLFNWFKELTLKDTQRVYDLLGVTFDSYNGEAFFNDKMGRVIDELKAKNLLTISDGASIVDLDEEKTGMPPCLILQKGRRELYATRDSRRGPVAQGRI